MRTEIDEKSVTIDKLRRDIKLTKTHEIENEIQSYIEECQRMRGMLETLIV